MKREKIQNAIQKMYNELTQEQYNTLFQAFVSYVCGEPLPIMDERTAAAFEKLLSFTRRGE